LKDSRDERPLLLVQCEPAVQPDLDRLAHQGSLADGLGGGVSHNPLRQPCHGRESDEGAQLLAGYGTIRIAVKFTLDGPEVTFMSLGEEIDAFIRGGEPQPRPNVARDLAPTPHASEFGLVLWLSL
jgi:hypothetical protein